VANLPQVLVRARAGRELVERRGGLAYARSELVLQSLLRRHGLQSALSSLLVGTTRAALFASPLAVRRLMYRCALRGRAAS
jgi:hypothetical protein